MRSHPVFIFRIEPVWFDQRNPCEGFRIVELLNIVPDEAWINPYYLDSKKNFLKLLLFKDFRMQLVLK